MKFGSVGIAHSPSRRKRTCGVPSYLLVTYHHPPLLILPIHHHIRQFLTTKAKVGFTDGYYVG